MTLANFSGPFSSSPPCAAAAPCSPAAGSLVTAAPLPPGACRAATGPVAAPLRAPDQPFETAHAPAARITTTATAGHGVRVKRRQAREGRTSSAIALSTMTANGMPKPAISSVPGSRWSSSQPATNSSSRPPIAAMARPVAGNVRRSRPVSATISRSSRMRFTSDQAVPANTDSPARGAA